ncbi:MAG: magnesium/cobalt transporter CorA [bacterium]|nr:magnesium/cobalt transporter CorA [bacterium]
MRLRFKRRKRRVRMSEKSGLPAGAAMYVGAADEQESNVTTIEYSENEAQMRGLACDRAQVWKDRKDGRKCWIHADGVSDVQAMHELFECFHLHPLVREDILNTLHRSKVEEYEDSLFLVMKRLRFERDTLSIATEQISMVLQANRLITFKEQADGFLKPLRERILQGRGKARQMGADYLLYVILDMIVDDYFPVLEALEDAIDWIDEHEMSHPDQETLNTIHVLKRSTIEFQKTVRPVRELVKTLVSTDIDYVSEPVRIYMRDVYDHIVAVLDDVETHRELLVNMMDLGLSIISNRLNEVMKVLTVLGALFVPPTLIAGIYGMNFEFMPELRWPWGYAYSLAMMAASSALAVGFLRLSQRRIQSPRQRAGLDRVNTSRLKPADDPVPSTGRK